MISLREIELSAGQATVEALDGATLSFDAFPIGPIPCTFTPINKDFQIPQMGGGFSSVTSIGIVLFRACFFEGIADDTVIQKGLDCVLTPIPGAVPMILRLWNGGLLPGAVTYKFMLVDRNFKG